MGCKPVGERYTNSCVRQHPGTADGVSIEFLEHPGATIRQGNLPYNVPARDGTTVQYQSDLVCNEGGNPADMLTDGMCGKANRLNVESLEEGESSGDCLFVYDYYPSGLSFDFGYSDTWFSYLFDTTNKAGILGTPCYHIETEETDIPESSPGAGDGSYSSSSSCFPCSSFDCTPASTTISYTVPNEGKDSDDPDCPHSTLFAVDTQSPKLTFSYDSLSTTLPDGCLDFELSYDGVTYTDSWNENETTGTEYITAQNPYQSGDEAFSDFKIFELDSGLAQGLRVKLEVKPVFDDDPDPSVFSGTSWRITEVLSPGTGYTVGTTFSLSYTHTLPDNSTVVLTNNIKIKTVGPVQATEGQEGFDVLRSGDTVNGHIVTRVFHTDIDNFPYHIAYLDACGSNFAKETQYTSDRNHVITAKAGWGIPDRAHLVGFYEFMNKSIQYVTADVDQEAPNRFHDLRVPQVTMSIVNGQVDNISIVDGGSGWQTLDAVPDVYITAPLTTTGKRAEVRATFVGGAMTGITVADGGSGYSSTRPPSLQIRNVHKVVDRTIDNGAYRSTYADDIRTYLLSLPEGDAESSAATLRALENLPQNFFDQYKVADFSVKGDPDVQRVRQKAQRMYSDSATNPLKKSNAIDDLDMSIVENSTVIPTELKDTLKQFLRDESHRSRMQHIDDITQKIIPEYSNHDERYVTTIQGRISELPQASEYTKYMMKQYRPDPQDSIDINITLSCSTVENGCGHISCTAPSGSTPGPNQSISMSGLLGDGCKPWTASGSMKIWNDLTRANAAWSAAIAAYGNPYDTGMYLP